MLKINSAALAAAVLVSMVGVVARAQTPIADYRLQDNYLSSVGTIGPLTVVGTQNDATFTDGATVDGHTQSVLNISVGTMTGDTGAGVQTQTQGFLASPANYSVVLLADFNISPIWSQPKFSISKTSALMTACTSTMPPANSISTK
jgi:hypothetical protein